MEDCGSRRTRRERFTRRIKTRTEGQKEHEYADAMIHGPALLVNPRKGRSCTREFLRRHVPSQHPCGTFNCNERRTSALDPCRRKAAHCPTPRRFRSATLALMSSDRRIFPCTATAGKGNGMQHGSLVRARRSRGPDVWLFRWSEQGYDGKRVCRKRVIGTIEDYSDCEAARRSVSNLIAKVN